VLPLLKQTIEQLALRHRDRSIRLEGAGPCYAQFDEVRLRQLFSNIIGNALQHSPADEPVTVKIDDRTGMVRIAVENGGPPIPSEMLNSHFTPFQRKAAGKKRAGLGLGPYIASEIARAHEGSIQVKSDAGGTVFTMLLPGAPAQAGAASPT